MKIQFLTMAAITVHNIHKSFAQDCALCGVSFEIAAGEIVALLGPSGCGKSTLLTIIAGLQSPDQGEIYWQGQPLGNMPAHERQFGLMFQDYALFPHKNVFQNIAFSLQMAHMVPDKIQERTAELLALAGLTGYAQRDTGTLSGGEQQRVALARSLAPSPRLLMLDEPLGSLDRALRQQLLNELKTILQLAGQTTLYVTHDQEEAFALADRVVIMQQGQIAQIGKPEMIYRRPDSPFVARFLGFENFFSGRAQGGLIQTAIGTIQSPRHLEGDLTVLIRPDGFTIGVSGPDQLEGCVAGRSFRGSYCQLEVRVNHITLQANFPSRQQNIPQVGETILLSYDPQESIQIFKDE